jgi:acetyl/propionyl-CoA carboxylase alpha subunit
VASEAQSSFGDGRFYVEKFLRSPHHIEVQVLADSHGNTTHLFERECSIQRRNQKVAEESPSPFMTPKLRKAMGEVAVRAAQAVEYLSAGTIEFLVDGDRNFYFMEMNTRIQVEHPITELVTGIDLVKAQIEIAAGGRVPFKQSELRQNGWAIECRVYAEDPEHGFVPAPGRIDTLRLPEGPGVRNDCGVYEGSEVSSYYDPMISKLVTWGRDRAEAIGRMRRALSEYMVAGTLVTNLNFHRWLMDNPRWAAGEYDTRFINEEYHPGAAATGADAEQLAGLLAAAFAASRSNHRQTAVAAAPGAGYRQSAWKTVGRIDSLRR